MLEAVVRGLQTKHTASDLIHNIRFSGSPQTIGVCSGALFCGEPARPVREYYLLSKSRAEPGTVPSRRI